MQPNEEKQIDSELNAIDSPLVTPPEHLSIQPKKKRHTVRNIIVTLLILAFLAAASYVGWLLVKPLEPAKTDTSQTTTTQTTTKLTAEKLIADIKPSIQGEVKETTSNGSGGTMSAFSTPAFRPEGFEFSVRASKESGFVANGSQSANKNDLSLIESTLKDRGLTPTILNPEGANSTYAASYQSDDITCSISNNKPYSNNAQYEINLGCADKESYVANAKLFEPYFAVYKASAGNDTTDVAMGALSTKTSKTSGYTTSTISIGGASYDSIGGFSGLFYTTPDKKIHFFKGTQNELLCNEYNTTDLKNAYLGETCYKDANSAAVVTL